MTEGKRPIAIAAASVPPRAIAVNSPRPFVGRMVGRGKHPLGDLFGLANFGVDLTRLAPGGVSVLRHAHSLQDEFIYVVVGTPTLVTDAGQMPLEPGMCAAFKSGTGDAHPLVNRTDQFVSGGRRPDGRRSRHLSRR